eukprot:TRINITY_DN5323_c0_g1_i1.p1 TRINITY_DN5323_c0_g1~~TRINITY_DN5323_c0_g1_i1.p1  ORF type:complete len:311 (-),score=82.30 TRINITY_DN5323_c0_g1_i1:70-1002(-)
MAVSQTDIFDFLIDIVPQDDKIVTTNNFASTNTPGIPPVNPNPLTPNGINVMNSINSMPNNNISTLSSINNNNMVINNNNNVMSSINNSFNIPNNMMSFNPTQQPTTSTTTTTSIPSFNQSANPNTVTSNIAFTQQPNKMVNHPLNTIQQQSSVHPQANTLNNVQLLTQPLQSPANNISSDPNSQTHPHLHHRSSNELIDQPNTLAILAALQNSIINNTNTQITKLTPTQANMNDKIVSTTPSTVNNTPTVPPVPAQHNTQTLSYQQALQLQIELLKQQQQLQQQLQQQQQQQQQQETSYTHNQQSSHSL